MMEIPRPFCKIVDVFEDERGITVHADTTASPVGYKAGDEVELRRPDGTRLKVASGLVLYNCDTYRLTNPEYEPPTAFYFHGLKKSDVPQGTELWQITEHKSKGEFKHWRFEKIEKEPGT